MDLAISHDLQEESFEAKARWFQSLSIDERMQMFCELSDLLLENNPDLVRAKDAQPIPDVFASFQKHDVRYVVIGGIAAVLHGVPRVTFDLDILIEATAENATRLLAALLDVRFGTASLTTPDEILANVITIFKDRVRIDVQTSTPGITFNEAWEQRRTMSFQGQPFFVVSLEHRLASKRAAGRPQDLDDVRVLVHDDNGQQPNRRDYTSHGPK